MHSEITTCSLLGQLNFWISSKRLQMFHSFSQPFIEISAIWYWFSHCWTSLLFCFCFFCLLFVSSQSPAQWLNSAPRWRVALNESERRLLRDEWLIRQRGVEPEWSSALHSQAAINHMLVSGCCQDGLLPTRVKPTEACEGRSTHWGSKWSFVFFIGQQYNSISHREWRDKEPL